MDEIAKALPAMLLVLTTWSVVGALLIGIGLAVGRLVDRTLDPVHAGLQEGPAGVVERLFSSFWLGFSALVLYLLIWSFFLPIRWPALELPLALAILGFALDRGALLAASTSLRSAPLPLVVIGFFALWLANRAIGQCMHLDTGIYHMQAVRWATSYPVVPGLAQLHGRFGFNNASHLFAALLEIGPLYGRSRHVVNGLFLLALTIPIASATRHLWLRRGRPADWFAIFLVPALARWSSGKQMNGLATDLPVDVIAVCAAWLTLRFLSRPAPDVSAPSTALRIEREALTVIAMMSAAICVKASVLPYAISMSLLAAGASSSITRRALVPRLRFGIASAVVLFSLLGTWMARGVVLTGYPVYPAALGGLPVEWRLPEERVSAVASLVRSWAREPGRTDARAASDGRSRPARLQYTERTVRDWAWLDRWWQYAQSQWQDFLGPLALALLSGIGLGVARLLGGERSTNGNAGFWLLVPASGAIVIWFLSAPAPRFASYAFWTLGAGTMARVVSAFTGRARQVLSFLSLACCLALTVVALSEATLFQPPGRDHGFWPVPRPKLTTASMSNGLQVRFARNEFCWDAPLPCTPTTPLVVAPQGPDLRLRKPGDLGSGFVYGPAGQTP